jgi:hypothetical protein
MGVKALDAGSVLRTISKMRVLDGSTLRNIVRMKVMDTGATLRTVATFATPLSVSITPPTLYKESYAANVLISDPATAVPSGGLGPYTYSWTIIAGGASVNPPTTNATVDFTSEVLVEDAAPEESTARVTCTDSSGQTATATVTMAFYFYNPFA